jgi:hypothetical protein
MSKAVCVACRHAIDDSARVCPYCGSDPRSGEKIIDAQAMLHEMFQPKRARMGEGILQFARQRQGIVIAIGVAVLVVLLAAFHQFVVERNATAVSDAAAVPLTDVADLSNQSADNQPQPMPDLKFQIDGNPKTMRSYIVEPGAVTPPDVLAQQQQQQQQQQQPQAAQQQPAPKAAPQPQPQPQQQ